MFLYTLAYCVHYYTNHCHTCMGEELSTLSIPSPATLPPPKNAVKIFKPTDNKLAHGDVGAIA